VQGIRFKSLKAAFVSVGVVVSVATIASGASAATRPISVRPSSVPRVQTSTIAPAITGAALANEHYFLAYISANGDILVTKGTEQTNGSVTWTAPSNTGQKSKTTPAIAAIFYPTYIVMVYVADNSSDDLLWTSSTNGTTWTPDKRIGVESSPMAPSLIQCSPCGSGESGGSFELAAIANNSSRHILVSSGAMNSQQTNITWSSSIEVGGQSSNEPPALSSFNNESTFVLAYVANNSSNDLLVTTSTNGTDWTPSARVGTQSSKTAPSMSEWHGNDDGSADQDILAYVANNSGDDLLVTTSTNNAETWSSPVNTGQQSPLAPALPYFGIEPSVAMTYVADNSNDHLLLTTSPNGGATWNPDTKV